MITYLLRLENHSPDPGPGWDAIENSSGSWVRELDSRLEAPHQELEATLQALLKPRPPGANLILFVNLADEEMNRPLTFDTSFLKMLCEHRCSIELWC